MIRCNKHGMVESVAGDCSWCVEWRAERAAAVDPGPEFVPLSQRRGNAAVDPEPEFVEQWPSDRLMPRDERAARSHAFVRRMTGADAIKWARHMACFTGSDMVWLSLGQWSKCEMVAQRDEWVRDGHAVIHNFTDPDNPGAMIPGVKMVAP